jgi:hypothetical protein
MPRTGVRSLLIEYPRLTVETVRANTSAGPATAAQRVRAALHGFVGRMLGRLTVLVVMQQVFHSTWTYTLVFWGLWGVSDLVRARWGQPPTVAQVLTHNAKVAAQLPPENRALILQAFTHPYAKVAPTPKPNKFWALPRS